MSAMEVAKASIFAGFLSEAELCTALQITKRTAADWRRARRGPPFVKLSRQVIYPEDGVRDFLRAQIQLPVQSGETS
jgi:hypothetical protein